MIKRRTSPLLLRAGLRYQLRHPWQLLLALLGIAMGVAVVLAVDLANTAAKASFALSAQQIRGAATHRILAPAGEVPDALYSRLLTSPGHPPMAPIITANVAVAGKDERFRLIGLDLFAEGEFRDQLPQLIRGATDLAAWLTEPDALAISRSAAAHLGAATGQTVDVLFQNRTHRLRVQAIGDESNLASRDLLVVDIATAQVITGLQGQLSHIDLVLDGDTQSWLEARLPRGVQLVEIASQINDTAGLSAAFELNLTAMSLLALLVGVFLIFNAISFSIVQRRNLLGRLRALGVSDREIYRLILLEAAVLAIAGTALGTLLGIWLGQSLTGIVAATISELYYQVSTDAMAWSAFSFAKSWGLGIVGTLFAAWWPARQAARTPPLTTLSRAALEASVRRHLPALALLGGGMIVAGLAVSLWLPGGVFAGFAGLFILLLGAALIAPTSLRAMHRLFSRLPLKGIGRIAVRNLDRHLSRLGTASAALMVALAASIGVAVMVDSMRGAVSDWLEALLTADVYIAAAGFEDGATLPAAVIATAPQWDTVAAVSSYRNRTLQVGGRKTRLIAADLAEQSRSGFDFVATTATGPWQGFDRGDVIISEPLAYRLRLSSDDTLALPTPDGMQPFRIAGVFRDFASEHGRLFIARRHYQRIWQDDEINTLALFATDDRRTALFDMARRAFAEDEAIDFTAAGEIYAESMRIFEQTFRITDVLRWLSIVVASIGVFSALMALQLERRKEYAILRALGLTRGEVSQLIVIESVMLGAQAGVMALPTGLAMAWILTDAIQLRAFGWSMPLSIAWQPLVLALLIGIVAALLASIYPAWRTAMHDPAPQLREE